MTITRITGDVHGMIERYVKEVIRSDCDFSLQIGDMGFNYRDLEVLDKNVDKFFGGNHDNYDLYDYNPHSLGNFGEYSLGSLNFYFIRGAFSLDFKARIEHEMVTGFKTFWGDEQLSREEMGKALSDYSQVCPKIMVTHTCPTEIAGIVGDPTILKEFGYDPDTFSTGTQELLQECFDHNQPDLWIFGHMHQTLDFDHKGTRFICLGELRSINYEDGKIIHNNLLDELRSK